MVDPSWKELGMYLWGIVILWSFLLFWGRKELAQLFSGYWVPFVPSTDSKITTLVRIIDLKKNQKFLDLGCGNGVVLAAMESNYYKKYWSVAGLSLHGIENSRYPYEQACLLKEKGNFCYRLEKKDFFFEDFSSYDIIYCYLFPNVIKKVRKKMQKECTPWTVMYSNAFMLKDTKAAEVFETATGKIYKYII